MAAAFKTAAKKGIKDGLAVTPAAAKGAHEGVKSFFHGGEPAAGVTATKIAKRALELGAFEPWKEWLTFAGARTGLRCVQLDEALRVAQIAGLIWYPGPSFNRCRPLITAGGAAELVRRNGIPREVAGSWGEALLQAVQAAQAPR